jgi:hypothetical protein
VVYAAVTRARQLRNHRRRTAVHQASGHDLSRQPYAHRRARAAPLAGYLRSRFADCNAWRAFFVGSRHRARAAAAQLAFGIWLNALHSRIDHFVDRVLFRRRHLAEEHLQRTARTLPHAEAADYIDDALVVDACNTLSLASAAVFRHNEDGSFARTLARGWDSAHVAEIPRADGLIVHLLAELEPVDLTDVRWPHAGAPTGIAQPLLAIPFVARHDVLGFVLYGGHVGGEAIDPDEKHLLAQLANAAAAAYDHVESRALQAEANELRAENAMLLREKRLLRETIDALRSVPRGVES